MVERMYRGLLIPVSWNVYWYVGNGSGYASGETGKPTLIQSSSSFQL